MVKTKKVTNIKIANKNWYKSKTFWVNVLAFLAFILSFVFGFNLPAEAMATILTVINVVLRMITKESIVWK